MDTELKDFISHLDDDVPFSPNKQMNEIWNELEEYMDRAFFDIDKFLDELFPTAQLLPAPEELDVRVEPSSQFDIVELLKCAAIPETFFNDLICDPVLDLNQKTFVPTEVLLNSIRAHKITINCRDYEHPYETISSSSVRPMAPLRNDFIADFNTNVTLNEIENVDWNTILSPCRPYPGITADEMVENVLRSSTKSQILPKREEILAVIGLLFKDLGTYIDRLAAEFKDHAFFDAAQFDYKSRKIQEEILSHSNIKPAGLRNILSKWIGTLTESFAHINGERQAVEEKVSERIIDGAVEVYRNRVMSLNVNQDTSIARKKQFDIVCQGISRIYWNCGENFTEKKLHHLEERLNRPRISIRDTAATNEVLIELLVSEYTSRINQKALQCASISTLKQFDDVNKICLQDILHIFEQKMSGVDFAERNNLKKRLISNIECESNDKRAEFKQRSHKVSEPSADSLTKSHTVGIHFGFETLSVTCFNQANNNFRQIYGPVVNAVSFAHQGVFIGEILDCSLNMENLLKNRNVDLLYDTEFYGKMKLEGIIALVLMSIDEMVKQSLHTKTRIRYAVAIPSCLNEVIQHSFKTAINIADINGCLVREQCALTTNFIRENHQAITKNKDELLVTMVEHLNKACDSVVYEINGKEKGGTIQVLCTSGSESTSRIFGFMNNAGFQCELEKIKSHHDKRSRFIICSADPDSIKAIKNKFHQSKVHPLKLHSSKISEGAALLSSAAMDGNSNFVCSFDVRHLTSIKRLSGGVSLYRLVHHSSNADAEPQNITEVSVQLRSLIDNQLQELAKFKAATKQLLMGKMKDLEEEAHLSENKKKRFRNDLQKGLKEVEEEPKNAFEVAKIADHWTNLRF